MPATYFATPLTFKTISRRWGSPQEQIGGAGASHTDTGIPPAEPEIGAGRPFTDAGPVRGTIVDVGQFHFAIDIETAIRLVPGGSEDTDITGEADDQTLAGILGQCQAFIRRAGEKLHGFTEVFVRWVIERSAI